MGKAGKRKLEMSLTPSVEFGSLDDTNWRLAKVEPIRLADAGELRSLQADGGNQVAGFSTFQRADGSRGWAAATSKVSRGGTPIMAANDAQWRKAA
jgi:hypothetical protein